MREILQKLARRQDLTRAEARAAFGAVLDGAVPDVQIAGLLMGLAGKGVCADELAGTAAVMREKVLTIRRVDDEVVLDTCGTGGDVSGTFNISTAAALLAAACGVKVVKHGGRSASGKTGSADVLEHLGVRLDYSPAELRACLDTVGICFAFARNHHPAMKHAAAVRSALGVPTIFNLVAPLLNPARACHQLLGVFDRRMARLLCGVLRDTGSRRAWVVHADDGLDELSTLGPTHVCELKNGELVEWTLDPASLGLARALVQDFAADSPAASADMILGIVNGRRGPARDIAALNAAAGLVICGRCADLAEGLSVVTSAIDSGKARRTLETLIAFPSATS